MGNMLAKWWLKNGLQLYESHKKEEAIYHWKRNVIKMRTSTHKYLTYSYLANISFNSGNFREYLTFSTCQLSVAEKLNDSRLLCEAYLQMAKANSMLGEYFRCIAYCREALKYDHGGSETKLEAQIYLNMGDMYYRLGYLERSIMCWQKALSRAQEADDVITETELLASIGKMHLDFGDAHSASQLFKQAYMLATRTKLRDELICKFDHKITLYFATMLQRLGYSTYAMLLIDSVINLASSEGNRWLCALAMIQRASALRGRVPDQEVYTICKISLATLKETGDKYNQINANLALTQLVTELPSLPHENFQLHLNDAMELAVSTGDKVSQFICNRISAEAYGLYEQNDYCDIFEKRARESANSMGMICPMCNCIYGYTNEEIDILPCTHIFHTSCIRADLERSKRKMQPCRTCGKLYAFNEGFLSLKL